MSRVTDRWHHPLFEDTPDDNTKVQPIPKPVSGVGDLPEGSPLMRPVQAQLVIQKDATLYRLI